MSINSKIESSRYNVANLTRMYDNGELFVDDTFQRRLVWGEKQKVKLIETILMGYPIPELHLHAQEVDPNRPITRYSIVDGQQRITSLVQFIANEWSLEKKYLDTLNLELSYAGKRWDQLELKDRKSIIDYYFNCRIVDASVTLVDVRKVFLRINETDKSLSPQEFRHARFDGLLITLAEDLANLDFFSRFDVFSKNDLRRMVDVEFTTSLIGYLRSGVVSDTAANINKLYDLYNDTYKERTKDRSLISERLAKISGIFRKSPEVAALFSKPVHLYTLFTAMDDIGSGRSQTWYAESLAAFAAKYQGGSEAKLYTDYRRGAEQRTRSKGSRDLRSDSLIALVQKFDAK